MVQLDLLRQVPSPESLCGLDQYCPHSGEILKREMALTKCNGVLSKDTDRQATETMKYLGSFRGSMCVLSHFSHADSLRGSSVNGILQARILEQVSSPPPGDLPNPETEPTFLLATCIEKEGSLPLGPPGMIHKQIH